MIHCLKLSDILCSVYWKILQRVLHTYINSYVLLSQAVFNRAMSTPGGVSSPKVPGDVRHATVILIYLRSILKLITENCPP